MNTAAIVLIALGGAFLLEGLGWAVVPSVLRRLYSDMMAQMSDKDLHLTGVFSVAIGAALLAWGAQLLS